MVKNCRKYGETVAVISSVIAMLESRWMQQVLYIPWILRINLFKPTNPKDELVYEFINVECSRETYDSDV